MLNLLVGKMPIANWTEKLVDWMTANWAGFFDAIQQGGQGTMDLANAMLSSVPPLLMIVIMTVFAVLVSHKKWGFPVFVGLGLLLVWNQGLWPDLIQTTTLVILSSLLAIVIGIPLGIWMAKSDNVAKVLQPLLDFMQTMPGFVYLIPAVAFFGIGAVPGVFASLIFSLPPTVRFTNLGIRQVPVEMEEAADSFGSTPSQKLFKVELPLAKSTIMAGVNQTIMLALSMVVLASMVGAPGLGQGILSAVQHADVGAGFVNGIALVILAITIDRFTQRLNVDAVEAQQQQSKWRKWAGWLTALILVGSMAGGLFAQQAATKKSVNLVYVQWDSEIASTNVLAQAFKEKGYQVKMTPLDNAVMWQTVANGQADGSVSAWLPNTHQAQYAKYHQKLNLLGPNMRGAKVGLVVPQYMSVNSIADLQNQADRKITGIEPGAGVMTAAHKAQETYPNLADWQVQGSSTGSMAVALDKAIKNHDEIVVTGWSPHWMWKKYNLKYLADPKGAMGKAETINTIARKGLKADKPAVYQALNNFHWQKSDMEEVMLDIQNGMSAEKAAQKWVDAHPKQVNAWFTK